MKKKAILALSTLLAVSLLVGCSGDKKVNNDEDNNKEVIVEQQPSNEEVEKESKAIDIKEVVSEIEETLLTPAMIDGTDLELEEVYGLNPEILSNYYMKLPIMSVSATEFAIFEAKTEEDIDTIVKGINKRLDNLETVWKDYLPDQYELVKNSRIFVKDKYVFFAVCENIDYAENAFEHS